MMLKAAFEMNFKNIAVVCIFFVGIVCLSVSAGMRALKFGG